MTAHPLIARLIEQCACPVVDGTGLRAFLSQPGEAILFCGGDPVQHPECLDVAVVLPELAAALHGRFRIAVASRELEPKLQALYGFRRWPSLIFLRNGQYLGVIQGMQDWAVYLQRTVELFEASVTRPPSIGIAIASSAAAHCH